MAATHRTEGRPADNDDAERLATAEFVRLVVAPSADAIAAAGILARALDGRTIPYHASIATTGSTEAVDEALVVAVGTGAASDADHRLTPGRAALDAARLVRAAGTEPAPGLVTACAITTGLGYRSEVDGALERTPGLGVAVPDVADGLAHTTLVHGPFSGEPNAATQFLEGMDVQDDRRIASTVALATIAGAPTTTRVGEALTRFLRPVRTPDGPFSTAPGTADVLDVLAATDPGLALAIVCGHTPARESALERWREEASEIHHRLATADPVRHPGLVVLEAKNAAVAPLARLLRDARSVVPTAAVIADGQIAVASATHESTDIAAALADHTRALVHHGDGRLSAELTAGREPTISSLREAVE